MANDAINRTNEQGFPSDSTNKPLELHPKLSDKADNRQTDTSQRGILDYFHEISGITGRQMLAILARIGAPVTTLSLEMNYSQDYISDYAKVRYPLTALPWRLVTQIRNKVGHLAFDTAYHELYKGRTDHILRLSGRELRQILGQGGMSISQLSRKMQISRAAITARIAKHFTAPLPMRFVEAVRRAIGETDYEVCLNKIRKDGK